MSETSRVTQAVARPVRTGAQLSVGEVIVQVIEAFFVDLTEAQHVALLGALTLALGILQVVVENKTGYALLRQVPPRTSPVMDTPDVAYYDPDLDDDVEDGPVYHELRDTGDYLEVPESDQEEWDPEPELNRDANATFETVPDGAYVELTTASDDEPGGHY